MLLLAAASIAALAPPETLRPAPAAAVVQARATVRIINGVRLRLDGERNSDAPPARPALIVTPEGRRPAQLIEFE